MMELESMWGAMKGVHYSRTIEQLENSVHQAKDLTEALTGALDKVVPAIHAQTGTFWFYDRFGDGRIHPRAVYGGGNLGGFSLKPGEGIAGQVIRDGKSTIVEDCQRDPRWAGKADAKTGFRTESMICVPLSHSGVVFGCIQLINRTDRMLFDKSDLSFAEDLARATATLFKEQGLLDNYLSGAQNAMSAAGTPAAAPQSHEVSFTQVFLARTDWDMERQLRRVEQFSKMRASEQKVILKLASEIRGHFSRMAR